MRRRRPDGKLPSLLGLDRLKRRVLAVVNDRDGEVDFPLRLYVGAIEKLDKIARKALKLETDKPRMAINIRLLGGRVARLANAGGAPAVEPPALVEDTGLKPADEPVPKAEAA